MGKYSLHGSPEFDAGFDGVLWRCCDLVLRSPLGPWVRGIVLYGSFGRGEGPRCVDAGIESPVGNLNLLAVTGRPSWPVRRRLAAATACLPRRLSGAAGLPVELSVCPQERLKQVPFTLRACELKYGHTVLWGDSRCLEELPEFPVAKIPLAEGVRLLLGRCRFLPALRRRLAQPAPLNTPERQEALLTLLAVRQSFGDAVLLANGRYELFLDLRRQALHDLPQFDVPRMEFVVRGFEQAVQFRETGDFSAFQGVDLAVECELLAAYVPEFLAWYERTRLGAGFRTASEYAERLLEQRVDLPPWRAVGRNLAVFGPGALRAGWRWLFVPPARRLLAVLPGLIAAASNPAAAALLNLRAGASRGELEAAAERLWPRLMDEGGLAPVRPAE